jgi:hypothetical protein
VPLARPDRRAEHRSVKSTPQAGNSRPVVCAAQKQTCTTTSTEREAAQARRRLKHRETQRRYEKTPKGRETRYRYQQSPKGRETQFRYSQSPKGADTRWRYARAPARLDYKREWARQYRKTALYKELQLNHCYARADAMSRELSGPGAKSRVLLVQFHRLSDFLTRREAQIRGTWEPAASTIRPRARRQLSTTVEMLTDIANFLFSRIWNVDCS